MKSDHKCRHKCNRRKARKSIDRIFTAILTQQQPEVVLQKRPIWSVDGR